MLGEFGGSSAQPHRASICVPLVRAGGASTSGGPSGGGVGGSGLLCAIGDAAGPLGEPSVSSAAKLRKELNEARACNVLHDGWQGPRETREDFAPRFGIVEFQDGGRPGRGERAQHRCRTVRRLAL